MPSWYWCEVFGSSWGALENRRFWGRQPEVTISVGNQGMQVSDVRRGCSTVRVVPPDYTSEIVTPSWRPWIKNVATVRSSFEMCVRGIQTFSLRGHDPLASSPARQRREADAHMPPPPSLAGGFRPLHPRLHRKILNLQPTSAPLSIHNLRKFSNFRLHGTEKALYVASVGDHSNGTKNYVEWGRIPRTFQHSQWPLMCLILSEFYNARGDVTPHPHFIHTNGPQHPSIFDLWSQVMYIYICVYIYIYCCILLLH